MLVRWLIHFWFSAQKLLIHCVRPYLIYDLVFRLFDSFRLQIFRFCHSICGHLPPVQFQNPFNLIMNHYKYIDRGHLSAIWWTITLQSYNLRLTSVSILLFLFHFLFAGRFFGRSFFHGFMRNVKHMCRNIYIKSSTRNIH